jgi:hypothetical protein
MERVKGIEPSSQAWEARILPLNHTRFECAEVVAGVVRLRNCSMRLVAQLRRGGEGLVHAFCQQHGVLRGRAVPAPARSLS